MSMYRATKRVIDVALAGAGLALGAPVFLAVAVAVRLDLGRPVLFRQLRIGRGEQPFELLKFRTMRDARDASGRLLPDDVRTTPVGRWLRRSSLDELPQLLQVLRGEMSLVGPRPLLPRYLPYYRPRERLRHRVRPGLTGWAQIHGRQVLDWDTRLELDAWYVEHASARLDLRILAKTVGRVVRGGGAVNDSEHPLPPLDRVRAREQPS